ncbi:hypothetical protein ACFSOZ_23135 [Mesorhizobium newzealandense]|uniref:Uncharacterized protein n=1 Tax=Mesorhizobium newzealandense TaxID=1300302 RepID=A0ABW4UH03_9HYPH
MNDILAKISSYNLFNNLVPGAILAALLSLLDIYHIGSLSFVADLVVYYFLGMVVSRVGSILIDPALRLFRLLPPRNYGAFIDASAKDEKILVLLETSNMYRTVFALLLVVFAAFNLRSFSSSLSPGTAINIGLLVLAALFLVSYRKQNYFITKRVEHHKS